MKKSDIQDEIMNKIQRKIDKDIERMKSKKDMDKSVEKQIRKQLLDLYLFQNANESQKKSKLVDRLNKRAKDILEKKSEKDYYSTSIWKSISYQMRKKYPECQLCGKNKSAEVHHIFPFMHQFEDVREEIFQKTLKKTRKNS